MLSGLSTSQIAVAFILDNRTLSPEMMIRRRLPVERIENLIFLIRGHKMMLDSDLAELY